MSKTEYQILEQIRLIKNKIENSPMDFDEQSKCIDAMQRILNITDKQPEFSDDELDAIYSAMSDYQDYGDEESEIANSVKEKLVWPIKI